MYELVFSFAELGDSLFNNGVWLNPVSVLTSDVAKVEGKWSAMLRRYLQIHLFGDGGLQTAGVPLELCGETYVLRARLGGILSDGDGLRLALQWRGASSYRPCFRHCNIAMRGMELGDAHFHEISSSEVERLLVHSQHDLSSDVESLLDAERRNINGTLSDAALEEARKIAGYNITQSGLLVDPDINAHRLALYDWPHTVFQDGVFKPELTLLLAACKAKLGSRKRLRSLFEG